MKKSRVEEKERGFKNSLSLPLSLSFSLSFKRTKSESEPHRVDLLFHERAPGRGLRNERVPPGKRLAAKVFFFKREREGELLFSFSSFSFKNKIQGNSHERRHRDDKPDRQRAEAVVDGVGPRARRGAEGGHRRGDELVLEPRGRVRAEHQGSGVHFVLFSFLFESGSGTVDFDMEESRTGVKGRR